MLAMSIVSVDYKPSPPRALKSHNRTHSSVGGTRTQLLMGPKDITLLAKVNDMSDPSCHVEGYDPPPVGFQEFPPYDEQLATVYRYRQQQSVNLASWFVHESWMTPSVFDCAAGDGVSEIDIAYGWGSATNARSVLERHWDTFISESDFQYLQTAGINTVRLPIGYWNLGPSFCEGTAFAGAADVYKNSWSRVVRAINMAGVYGLGVLVDLHGAVGSQNGQDHSGVSDGEATLFSDPGNMDKTINLLIYLIQQLVRVNNVVGIEILNEPRYVDGLESFYNRAIDAMRGADADAAKFPIYLHNGFDMDRFSQYLSGRSDFTVEDHHSYFVYTDADRRQSAVEHAKNVQSTVSSSIHGASDKIRRNMVVGEFSCALTPESISASSYQDAEVARKDFCRGQIATYAERTGGWHFWGYLKEDCDKDPGWCFKSAIGSILPTSFSSYPRPSQAWLNITPEDTKATYANSVNHPFSLNMKVLPKRRREDQNHDSVDTRGYNDGKLTAQTFASHNASKLGFINQYIHDSIEHLGPSVVAPGTEGDYYGGFWRGLLEAQDAMAGP